MGSAEAGVKPLEASAVDITSNLLFIQCHLLFVDLQNVVILTILSSAFYRLFRIGPQKIYLLLTKQRLNGWTQV